MTPPLLKSETNSRFRNGGVMGEVLGERGRFGGREPPLRKRGSCASKVFLLFLSISPLRRGDELLLFGFEVGLGFFDVGLVRRLELRKEIVLCLIQNGFQTFRLGG